MIDATDLSPPGQRRRLRGLGPNAHLIGIAQSRAKLDTPALVVDLKVLETNIAKMAELATARKLSLRPHAKTHKCVEIARRQIAAGALGVSCTILAEAEAMVHGGIGGVLLTSPAVTPAHIARLIALSKEAGPSGLMVVCDHPANAEALSTAAEHLDHPLGVLADYGAGYNRTGAATEGGTIAVAKAIAGLPHLKLCGLQAYAGNIQHIESRTARSERSGDLREQIRRIIATAAAEGVNFPIVTGAGTGTHDLDGAPFTELQPGSYVFGDAQYTPVLLDGRNELPFDYSLFLQAAVVSCNAPAYVTLDAGVKSLATDGPLPIVARGAAPDSDYAFFGDEHGRLFVEGERPAPGAKIELVTPHCDPTVNLHDWLHIVDGETLVAIWPIEARGH